MKNLYKIWSGFSKLKLLPVFLLTILSFAVNAQISVNQNFDAATTPPGWTYSGYTRTTTTPCAGAASLRGNRWSGSVTGSIAAPLFTSSGQDLTISYSYKLLNYTGATAVPNTPAWGSIVAEVSLDGGTTYTVTAGTIDPSNHVPSTSCAMAGTYTVAGSSLTAGANARVRLRTTWLAGDYYVYFDDVVITQSAGPACSGTPSAGTVPASAAVCAGLPYTLVASGSTTGVSGLTGQWEFRNPSATGVWANLAGATTSTYMVASMPATPTDYRYTLTCSGNTGTSNELTTTINAASTCYCIPASANATYFIDSFTTTGAVANIANNASGYSPTGYGNFTGQTVSQSKTSTVNFRGKYNSSTYGTKIWVDWNQNGVFTDAGEVVYSSAAYASAQNGSFVVPASALEGNTRMRVGISFGTNSGPANSCNTSNDGEYEDYTFNVLPAPLCPAPSAVAANTITSSSANVTWTGTGTYILEYGVTGFTPGTDATAGTGGTIISGATSPTALTSLTPATGYSVYIRQDCTAASSGYSLNGTATFTTNSLPPSNNECSTATVLTVNADLLCGVTSPGTLVGATASAGPTSTCGTFDDDVWYSFVATAPSHQVKVIHVSGSATDYSTQVLSSCGATTALVCSDPETLTASGLTIGNTYYVRVASYFANPETSVFNVCIGTVPPCSVAPTSVSTNMITSTTANVNFTSTSTNNIVEYGLVGFTPGTDATPGAGGTIVTGSTSPISISGLTSSTSYRVYVRSDCSGAGLGYSSNSSFSSFTTLGVPPVNDIPATATALTVGAGCTGAPYTTVNGTVSAGEPTIPCGSNAANAPVWFSFVAPASGSVRVSNDYSGGTNTDTKMAVYSATNAADFSTFQLLSCDEDGGSTVNFNNVMYNVGLTAGTTYYVVVDNYSTSSGTFCMTVDELSNSMLSSSVAACAGNQAIAGTGTTTAWVSIMDANSKLVAQVRNNAGMNHTAFSSSNMNINTTGPRIVDGDTYTDRSFRIGTATTPAGSYDVRLFELSSETSALAGGLSSANIKKVSGSACVANPVSTTGTDVILSPTATASTNGVDMLQFTTTSFSNFYITSATPLAIGLENIAARNTGAENVVTWNSLTEKYGDKYELQRSADGRSFSPIANVDAKGQASNYSYVDAQPIAGINYYRLRMHTAGSSTAYSKVVTATLAGKTGFDVVAYPNPTSRNLNIKIAGSISGQATLTITDVLGKVVRTVEVYSTDLTINMQQLAAGIYMVKYQDAAHTQTIKVKKD